MADSIYLLAVLCAVAGVAEWLGRFPAGRWLGGAIISLILGMLLANAGLIPTVSNAPPLYEYLIAIGAPAAIFLLLLDVRLSALKRAGLPMLVAFGIGSLGTLVGVATAFWITNAGDWLGRFAAPVGGMYAATYIGGSANLTAVALHYGVTDEPALFAAANVADSVVGTAWLVALVLLVQLLHRLLGTRPEAVVAADAAPIEDARPVSLIGVGLLLALALGSLWLSQRLSAWAAELGAQLPAMLILTTVALIAAHVPAVHRLGGARVLGMFGAYLFLAVIGASCDLEALAGLGRVGGMLVLFVVLVVLIHGVVQFGVGRLLRLSPETLAIASSANVGGTLTIMPIATGLRRMDLLLPGILVGSLGNAIGTYAGFLMVAWLQSAPAPISAAQAIPPPPLQSVADCDRPTYASDQLVCADPGLLALDRELRDLLATVDLQAWVAPTSLLEPQDRWFRRRSRCAFSEEHAACLKAAYSERITVISAIGLASAGATQLPEPAACRDAPWGSSDVLIRRSGSQPVTVLDRQARVLAVAFVSARGSDWSPSVRFAMDGATIRLTTLDGTTVECLIRPAD